MAIIAATMHIAMVKKRLANGEACRKCVQAEDLLKNRGLWSRIDEVVWANEGDADSPGMRLAAKHGISVAPFFVVTDADGKNVVYDSVLKLIKERLGEAQSASPQPMPDADVETAAREFAGRHPSEVLRWGLERWGSSLGIAFSGAEDVVLVHMASEIRLPFSVFCLDTGRLHSETYRFIDSVRKKYGVEVALMSPQPEPVQALVKKKGLFSFYEDGHQECCGIRKVEPLRRALGSLRAWANGQRRDQSPATRSAIAPIEWDSTFRGVDGPLVKLNPLAEWSSAQTWQFIRDNGVPFNPLHERGFISIGCEPCTRATLPGEHERAGRWWWEESTKRECGLHLGNRGVPGVGPQQ